MTLVLGTLYALAILDATQSGYAAAAGRSALVRKRVYYLKAMGRGFLLGQLAAALSLAAILLALWVSPDPSGLRAKMEHAGVRMLQVYLPFTAVILLAFAFRVLPSVDVRCMTSTLVFGPLTGIRPAVGLAGLVWGVWDSRRPALIAGGAAILLLWLSLERLLGWFHRSVEGT